MAISKRKRFQVMQRDRRRCYYCRAADQTLTIDHVVPRSAGGSDELTNLVAACGSCNYGKGPILPDDRTVFEAAVWACLDTNNADTVTAVEQLFGNRSAEYWLLQDDEDLMHSTFSPCISAARFARVGDSCNISAHERSSTIRQVEDFSDPQFCEECCTADAAAYNHRPGRLLTMRPLTGFELVR